MTQATKTRMVTPVARLVSGDLFRANNKDQEGRPLLDSKGAPRSEYYIGVAISKSAPEWPAIHKAIMDAGRAGHPMAWQSPTFSWKITDGDSTTPNQAGKRPCDQEGHPGHWILKMKTSIPISVYSTDAQSRIVDPGAVKRGDYIRVYFAISANKSTSRPGVYLNPDMAQFIGYGDPITSGPDAAQVFGAPATPPPGASSTPVASAPPMAYALTAAPTLPPPAPDFLVPPAPPAASVERRRIVSGQSYTEKALREAGWTEDQIASAPEDIKH